MTILDEISDFAKERVARAKDQISTEEMKSLAYEKERGEFPFEQALRKDGLSFILECKKASPSKGIIADDFPYLQIAKDYETAGCDAISVLTEPKWFLGQNEYLREIASAVSVPVLRKDFVVDEYMIYEAKTLGAAAVLLIVSILTGEQLEHYLRICEDIGLSALVEVHDKTEARTAVKAGAGIIGVNNRNLKDFSVDTQNAAGLREEIPSNVLFVSESGVKTPEDIRKVNAYRADAVLIGETMMRAADKTAALQRLRGDIG